MTKPFRGRTGGDSEPGRAPGHRHAGPPPEPRSWDDRMRGKPSHDQPWIPKSGLVGRIRRSPRQ